MRRETLEDLVARDVSVGLLGHGTVGSAFETLLAERADAVAAVTGARPEVTGVLTRSRGSISRRSSRLGPDRRADGRARAGARLRAAGVRAGKHVVSANKQLLSNHGEELWATAREHGVRLLHASRARWPGRRAGHPGAPGVAGGGADRRVHGIVNGTTNYILSEMAAARISYEEALRQARDLELPSWTRPTT